MSYEFDSRIRYSEVNEKQELTIAGILDYFQDCSTFQSEDLGIGLDYVKSRNRAWFITYWQIDFLRRPMLGERVKIFTSPYEFKGIFGKRNFWMEDQKGQLLTRADSLWVYMDIMNEKPARIEPELAVIYGKAQPLPMEKLPRKIRETEDAVREESFQVVKSHLDTNHHVNNVQYIYMAQQYLPENAVVKHLRVEYRKQAVFHDEIVPWISRQENLITVSLCDEQKKAYAVLEFTIE